MSYSALPEANRAVCPGKRLVGNRLRNSCNLHKLRGHWAESVFRLRQDRV